MSKIERVELLMVDLTPKTTRKDAIQSFVSQETPIVKIIDSDGVEGVGYTYTIGTGGGAIVSLLKDSLLPLLIGRDPANIEAIWRELKFSTNATTVGAITSLALAAIDTALWDLRCKTAKLPLHIMAGGAKTSAKLYTTEGGWLQLPVSALVEGALEAKTEGFGGAKLKVGKDHVTEDFSRLSAVRKAVGDDWELMVDANQCFTTPEAIRRARRFESLDLAWLEEPLPAMDYYGHKRLSESTSLPIAIGESLYCIEHFREYMQNGACSVIQVDVARVGGITPWLKVAHLAESYNLPVCPHFLMEIHVSLVCAVPNAEWVEYIPQLENITERPMIIGSGDAFAPTDPGLGIAWDWGQIETMRVNNHTELIV